MRWSDFSCLTISEFTNQVKLPFSKKEHLKIFPTSLAKWNVCAFLRFRVREIPEKYFLLSARRRELYEAGPWFLLFDKYEYRQRIFRSVILVSIFMLRVYVTLSLFLKIWLKESILQRIAFQRNLLLIGF